MKEQRRVYKALAQARKEELGKESEKVELSKIDDLRKRLDKHLNQGQKYQSELSSIASDMLRRSNDLEQISKEAADLMSKAKELGISDSSYSFVSDESKGYASTLSSFAKLIARNNGSL